MKGARFAMAPGEESAPATRFRPVTSGAETYMAAKKFSIRISSDECKGCGRCLLVCPKSLISTGTAINRQGYVAVVVNHPDGCIGCGSCFYQCPEPGAITIFEED